MSPMIGALVVLAVGLASVHGHGYLLEPVARSSAWLVDQSFRSCCSYSNHMEMYCGGIQQQWNVHGEQIACEELVAIRSIGSF